MNGPKPSIGTDPASEEGEDDQDQNPVVALADHFIIDRPWLVVLAFVVATAIMLPAAPTAFEDTQTGAGQFQEDVPEYDEYEAMQEDFERSSRADGGVTGQLFLDPKRNVLSRQSLLSMVAAQEHLESSTRLRIASSTSPGSVIAMHLDPTAMTPEAQYRVLEGATDQQLTSAIEATGDRLMVDVGFTPESASADVAQVGITYDLPPEASTEQAANVQFDTLDAVDQLDAYTVGENVVMFANGVFDEEVGQLLGDSSAVVFPAAIVLILLFLIVAYRDPIDLVIGLVALAMVLIWTFGFMGYVGIPYSDSIFTVFPLLLAVGIDFGIHTINRYREERAGDLGIGAAMDETGNQLGTAFVIVTLTTMFSFAANLTSPLAGIRDFGIVAGVGIIFTFVLFGVFLPAAKVGIDRLRQDSWFPGFGSKPIGREGSLIGRGLALGTKLAMVAPVIVLVSALVLGAGGAAYGSGVDVEFSEEVFFPNEERIETFNQLPGPLAPGQYNFVPARNYLEEDFEIPFVQTVTIYVDDRDVRSDFALRDIDRATSNPPDAFESTDRRRGDAENVLDVIQTQAVRDRAFADVIDRYDETGNGVPDREVDQVYDALFESSAGGEATNYLTRDRGSTRIQFSPAVDASNEEVVTGAERIASNMRLDATATGDYIISESVNDRITTSAVNSLVVAFVLVLIVLLLAYWRLEGRAVYGIINLVPILLTVAMLVASMRFFDIALSPVNAPLLGVTIGLGVDYTVHFMHRYVDEVSAGKTVSDALSEAVHGTGGAMTGSMLTTVSGLGVLYLALIPVIAEFGLLLALGVLYAYLSAILVLPSVIVLWERVETVWRSNNERGRLDI
ncbi:MAG: MMPL family transporter [Halodesulfurarchaeum sp.]|nr:MMPL family transporter [Halodesulfurarchaeum sp.]